MKIVDGTVLENGAPAPFLVQQHHHHHIHYALAPNRDSSFLPELHRQMVTENIRGIHLADQEQIRPRSTPHESQYKQQPSLLKKQRPVKHIPVCALSQISFAHRSAVPFKPAPSKQKLTRPQPYVFETAQRTNNNKVPLSTAMFEPMLVKLVAVPAPPSAPTNIQRFLSQTQMQYPPRSNTAEGQPHRPQTSPADSSGLDASGLHHLTLTKSISNHFVIAHQLRSDMERNFQVEQMLEPHGGHLEGELFELRNASREKKGQSVWSGTPLKELHAEKGVNSPSALALTAQQEARKHETLERKEELDKAANKFVPKNHGLFEDRFQNYLQTTGGTKMR